MSETKKKHLLSQEEHHKKEFAGDGNRIRIAPEKYVPI